MTAGRGLVSVADLSEDAGETLDGEAGEAEEDAAGEGPAPPLPAPDAIEAALRAENGNVARAAARLGMTRSRLRRFITRAGLDLSTLRG